MVREQVQKAEAVKRQGVVLIFAIYIYRACTWPSAAFLYISACLMFPYCNYCCGEARFGLTMEVEIYALPSSAELGVVTQVVSTFLGRACEWLQKSSYRPLLLETKRFPCGAL